VFSGSVCVSGISRGEAVVGELYDAMRLLHHIVVPASPVERSEHIIKDTASTYVRTQEYHIYSGVARTIPLRSQPSSKISPPPPVTL
jgi:hypothetical protein